MTWSLGVLIGFVLVESDLIVAEVIHIHCCHQIFIQHGLELDIVAGFHQLVKVDCGVYMMCSGPYVGFHQLVETGHLPELSRWRDLGFRGGRGV